MNPNRSAAVGARAELVRLHRLRLVVGHIEQEVFIVGIAAPALDTHRHDYWDSVLIVHSGKRALLTSSCQSVSTDFARIWARAALVPASAIPVRTPLIESRWLNCMPLWLRRGRSHSSAHVHAHDRGLERPYSTRRATALGGSPKVSAEWTQSRRCAYFRPVRDGRDRP